MAKSQIIKIDNEYSIEFEGNQFVLRYEKTYFDDKKQKDVLSTQNYYCVDIHHTMKVYQREKLRTSEKPIQSAQDIIDAVKESENTIKKFITENYIDVRLKKK